MYPTKNSCRTIWICVLLAAVTAAAFAPVVTYEFINFDDPAYVSVNLHVMDGLHWKNIVWAFQPGFSGNWHPLTWISHMLDVQLFGLNSGWHHLVSLLFHVANTLLLFLLFQRLTGATWRSATIAALFALHPLHVESVAWISERKDVLSAFFFLLTLWAYARYASDKCRMTNDECRSQRPEGVSESSTDPASRFTFHVSHYYLLSLFFFAVGLMSKPMLVTVPFVLLLLDYWPLSRFQNAEGRMLKAERGDQRAEVSSDRTMDQGPGIARAASRFTSHVSGTTFPALLREKIPFFVLSALSCVVTFRAQSWGGAVRPLALLSLDQRASNAIVSYGTYLKQTLWPAGLAVFYPLSEKTSVAATLIAGILLLGITAWAVAPGLSGTRSSRPWRVMGWFWFLGMLVPVIGLVQVGMQQTADRYTYLPLVGLFVMVVWEVSERLSGLHGEQNHRCAQMDTDSGGQELVSSPPATGHDSPTAQPFRGRLVPSASCQRPAYSIRAGSAVLTAATGAILLACAVLTWLQVGYWHGSERLFRHALAVTRDNWLAHNCLGHALLAQGNEVEAIIQYEAAAAIQPRPEIRFVLGQTLSRQHRYEEAVAQFSEMLKVTPENVPVLVQIGIARAQQGKTEEAVQALSEALRIDPADAGAHNTLGNILAQHGRYEEAVKQFEEAVRLNPDHAGAHNNLAISCKKLGQMDKAIAHYREALRLEPDSLQALNNLAWTLATCPKTQDRNGAEAVQLATKACDLTRYQNPIPLATLAAAYAETGRFEEAISFSERAQDLAKGGQGASAAPLAAMLEAFRASRPYHAE
jgi:protein O-mannosyl-transferase